MIHQISVEIEKNRSDQKRKLYSRKANRDKICERYTNLEREIVFLAENQKNEQVIDATQITQVREQIKGFLN